MNTAAYLGGWTSARAAPLPTRTPSSAIMATMPDFDVVIAAGTLRCILAHYEPPPLPIHVLHPSGGHVSSKVRLFIDAAVADLRGTFAQE